VASITTSWPDPKGPHCWSWFRISHNAGHGCNYSGTPAYYWAFNDTSTEGGRARARQDRMGIKACHAQFGGQGSVFLAYHPSSGGWPFAGHEPKRPKRIVDARFMEMYTGKNLADAPYSAWYSRRSRYSPMINVGAPSGQIAKTLEKYCKASARIGVYTGTEEVHSADRANVVYNALDACTGGLHEGL